MPGLDLFNVVVLLGRLQPPDHVVHGIDELDDHDGVDIDDHGDVEIMLSMVVTLALLARSLGLNLLCIKNRGLLLLFHSIANTMAIIPLLKSITFWITSSLICLES